MGPGGVGTTRGLPTAGLKSLLAYYGGDGPSRDKLATFIRTYLVYDGDAVPDALIDRATRPRSIPRSSPTRRCSRPSRACARCGGWTSPATARLSHLPTPTLVIWGRDDKVNRRAAGRCWSTDAQRRACS